MASRIAVIVLAACAACGGGSGNQTFATGSASVTGTIGGVTMTPKDAISNVLRNGTSTVGSIVITTADSGCAKISNHQATKNVQIISIGLGTQSGTTIAAPSAPGTFPVYSSVDSTTAQGPAAVAIYAASDASCHLSSSLESVTGGNVTLTRVDATGFAGTFDITFAGTAGHITGSFGTATCAALGTTTLTSCI